MHIPPKRSIPEPYPVVAVGAEDSALRERDTLAWERPSSARSVLRGAPCGRRFRRSHRRAHPERRGDASGAAGLIRVSPAAWQPINLYGRSEFRKAPETIDRPALIPQWDPIPVQPDLAV